MTEPFELIYRGIELYEHGDFNTAMQSIQRGIEVYKKKHDNDGVAFGLGRLGYCYEQLNEFDKAESTYEEAVQLGTDIPATYSSLVKILISKKKLDRVFEVVEVARANNVIQLINSAYYSVINNVETLISQERYDDALDLLDRMTQSIDHEKESDLYWSARSETGHVYEKAGESERALEHYLKAISDGSTNRKTYTRCLILMNKRKMYDGALKIIKKGLKIQRNASWEADLRKREQRILKKTGVISKATPNKTIPDFTVRKGDRTISFIQQIKYQPQLFAAVRAENRVFGILRGKQPKLFNREIGREEDEWIINLPRKFYDLKATRDSIVLLSREGAVGYGQTTIFFYGFDGTLITDQRLPDVPTELQVSEDRVYVGCRDGGLNAFSTQGKLLWRYSVPGSKEQPESQYSRPCPYFVSAGNDGVVFSSFNSVFALNRKGKLLYCWETPIREQTSQSELISITYSESSPLRALCAGVEGTRILVATTNELFDLKDDNVLQYVKLKKDHIHSIAKSPDDTLWAVSVDNKVIVFRDGKRVGTFPNKGPGGVIINQEANRILAWSRQTLSVATCQATLIAEIEFARDIHLAECLNDGKILIGTRYLITLDTNRNAMIMDHQSMQTKAGTPPKIGDQNKEESGIPIRWIEAEKISVGKRKAIYMGSDRVECTIEQVALEQYKEQGYAGAWTENDFWWMVMTLLFWDVIYVRLSDVYSPQFGDFPGRNQDMPRDFFTPAFYSRRKILIKKRMQQFQTSKFFGLVETKLGDDIKKAYQRHYGKPCRMIEDWDRYSLEALVNLQGVLPHEQLLLIMMRLLENFNDNRRGMPDLFLANPSGEPVFVEVKAQREKVADHQIEWLHFLRDQLKVSVEICRVIAR